MSNVFTRRKFLWTTTIAAASVMAVSKGVPVFADSHMDPYATPPLPYAQNALQPVISARTVSFHYGKHTTGYYAKTKKAVAGTPLDGKSVKEIFLATAGNRAMKGTFDNAAQAWNHTFYWHGMKMNGGGKPSGKINHAIDKSFGSCDRFHQMFAKAAGSVFGSGWTWLVQDGDRLRIVNTANAHNPMTLDYNPLLVIDVWEHAYYLDYQNRRAAYIKGWLEQLVNWDFAEANMK